MSRGPGHIQRTIRELIERNPDGAWKTGDLCWIIYKRITKAKRVAVSRALRGMTMPGTWETRRGDAEYWLYDPCNLASMRTTCSTWDPVHFKPGGSVYERVERAKRYRDASPIKRIEMQIESVQKVFAMVKMAGTVTPEVAREFTERMRRLQEEKAKLAEQSSSAAAAA